STSDSRSSASSSTISILRALGIDVGPKTGPLRRHACRSRAFGGKSARAGGVLGNHPRESGKSVPMKGRPHRRATVRMRPGHRTLGWLTVGPTRIPVALGRSGILADKREGDGATPRGAFRPLRVWWRADRLIRPQTRL